MKSFKRLILASLLVGFVSLTSACVIGKKIGPSSGGDSIGTSEPSSFAPVENEIGADGGTVSDNENITLNIPANALEQNTNITAQYIAAPELISNELSLDFAGGAEFLPSGTTFNEPVTVTIALNQAPKYDQLAVFCYYEAEDVWEYVTDASINGNNASFEITHFSKYQVLNRTKDFLNEYTNIVRHAKVNGLSDTEITDAFRDYLINNKHIMDYYIQYNGYWYEPCGLTISGNYKINGEEGDPNQLIRIEGEENRVGNKYGMCMIDGATSSKAKVAGASESSEIFDIMVLVEYKLINPDIELTTSKKNLKKGESTTINVRCHYTNVANFFPEFKDLELAGYLLRISKPTHFSTDKTAFVTNSEGLGSFVVTALENNKAETITVSFDVTGDFGTHAEGNITLNSQGVHFSGHIKEEKHMTYKLALDEVQYSFTVVQNGTFDLVIEYDFEGDIIEGKEEIGGTLAISNVTASFSSIGCHLEHDNVSAQYDVFNNIDDTKTYDQSIDFVAAITEDSCSLTSKDSSKNIAVITGSGAVNSITQIGTYTEPNSYTITVAAVDNLLLDFSLEQGTHTLNSTSFVDDYSCISQYYGDTVEFEDWNFDILSNVETVTQTITIL